MKIQVQRTLNTCTLSILFISSLIITISTANAGLITFQFKGVITEVGMDVRRIDDSFPPSNSNTAGYMPGDMFSGSYTFESDQPTEGPFSPDFGYVGISNMSFTSTGNTLSTTSGSIYIESDDGELHFQPIFNSITRDVNEGMFYGGPSISPESLTLSWFITPDQNTDFETGPPTSPLFDSSIPRYTTAFTYNVPPVYGNINITFSSPNSTIKGAIHSVTVEPITIPPTETNLVTHWPLNDGEEVTFNGNDDFVDLGSLDVSGEALSLTAKVESAQLNNCSYRDCRIVSKAMGITEQDHYWMLSTIKTGNKTRLRFRLKTNGVTRTLIASTGNLNDDVAFQVAATYDGSTMRLYKDGIEVGNLAKTGAIDTNSAVKTWIGGNPNDATSRPWKGIISDVKIYNKVLTTEEIGSTMD